MIDVVAAVIELDGLYLACRRTPARGGLWEFPGGKVDPDETPEQALVREIREELDVEVTPAGHLTTVEHGDLRLIFLHAQLAGQRPLSSTDHDQLEWLAPEHLRELEWGAADRSALEALLSRRLDDHEAIMPTMSEGDS